MCKRFVMVKGLAMSLIAPSIVMAQTTLFDGGSSIVSAEVSELEMGPNVGSQPKPPPPGPPPQLVTQNNSEPPAPVQAAESRLHLTLGTDYTTAYFSRGYRSEDTGWILQPYADLSLDVFRLEDATISLLVGTWNSFQGEATDAGTSDDFRKTWYESDVYAGVGLTLGNVVLEARYYIETSPSDAWDTIEEVALSAAYDDSELLGAWSLQPTAVLYIETGSNSIDGGRNGTCLQLGVSPGFSFDEGTLKDVEVSFPVSVGLSLSNYYEGANGENDFFGYASVGATVSVPLNLDSSWGAWTLWAGVQGLYLGDAASTSNDNDHTEVIGTVGISVEF